MNASFAMDVIRSFFSVIDGAIYWLISLLYEEIEILAQTPIFKAENINDFSRRVYTLIGIIMLFKVTFSLISYLVNPDIMNDKKNGTGNLAKNIIVTLFLIIIVPFGFDLLYSAQSAILKDHLIEKLILGTSEDYALSGQYVIIDEQYCVTTNSSDDKKTVIVSSDSIKDGDYLSLMVFRNFYQIYDNMTLDDNVKREYCGASKVSELLKSDIYNAETEHGNLGQYIVNYQFFLSTACGVLVMLLLLEFCFDVAMRSIKLGFLEIFAPVAIISYIDPKSSENGTFKKWLNEVIGTWARLFIRLAILNFAIYIIKAVNENVGFEENGIWTMLFLIIGALLFAKKAVPLIENIIGIKSDHSLQLNPFKKIREQAVGGKQIAAIPGKTIAGTTGMAISTGANIAANIKKRNMLNEKRTALLDAQERMQQAETNMIAANRMRDKARQKLESYQTRLDSRPGPITLEESVKLNKYQEMATKTQDKASELEKVYNKANADFNTADTKLKKQEEENDVFSYNHAIASTFIQALRGAKLGFDDKEAEKIGKSMAVGFQSAKKAAKLRNDYDKFGLIDRMRDYGSDITGIKNQSGTTSEISKAIREQSDYLANIENNISTLRQALSRKDPTSLTFDSRGEVSINETYNFAPGEKESTQYIINQLNSQVQAQKDTKKAIKEYQELKDLRGPKGKSN